ncbi:MAG: phosphoribosylanthranilate isomerase [Nitrososphaerota archaeon]|nr:phosphoribosylanthranilate isomerase [Candidatus Bathyarchaeota archaeon]MDW8048442.1 phosphoribosylanthranilate isomerase [Nitrososphaerota archaeon]
MGIVKVKICGITREEDLFSSIEAGADAVGFVVGVPSSPRNLTAEQAGNLIRRVPVFVESVVVTVATNPNLLLKIYRKLEPDAIQIHGELPYEIQMLRKKIRSRLIRAVHTCRSDAVDYAVKVSSNFDAVLLDTFAVGKYGGTGMTHNWQLSRKIRDLIAPKPLILAGGLRPDNVKDAIVAVHPYAVDVSSGVESRCGLKDPNKIFEFVRNAKEVIL